MNRKITFSIMVLALIACAGWLYNGSFANHDYQPRTQDAMRPDGQFSLLSQMRNNQVTGDIPAEAVSKVKAEIAALRANKSKAEWPITWEFAGPDNKGGRTRAILIDKDDNNIIYAGGVSGTVYRSNNKGGSWFPLEMDNDGFGVVALAQTDDGSIFAGTSETFIAVANLGREGSGFFGSGIYKSTDGESFEQVSGTSGFGFVAALVVDPTEPGTVYAATQNGLRYSSDGGATWQLARAGACRVAKFNKNGRLMANFGSQMYRTDDPKTSSTYERIPEPAGAARMDAAWGSSDPNVAYIITAGVVTSGNFNSNSGLTGLWRSTDGGASWEKIVERGSQYFSPFTDGSRGQAWYDMCIAVHPRDADRVFIGGIDFAEWTLAEGPKIVGNRTEHPTNPFGIHADKHVIVFDDSGDDPIMYVGHDGGVSSTTNADLDRYATRSTNYTTTQFYTISANPSGQVFGGTQDQGCILVSTESFPRKPGDRIWGVPDIPSGDGFGSELSHYDEEVMFYMSQQGSLARSVDGGQNGALIWDNRIRAVIPGESYFHSDFATGLYLWEDMDMVEETQLNGRTELSDSLFRSRLFFYVDNGIWMCNNATKGPFNSENPTNENIRWFKLARATTTGRAYQFSATRDGNSLFAGTTNGKIWRIDGLNKANWDTTEITAVDGISDSLTLTDITSNLIIGGRYVTDIDIDPSDNNRVIISLGNYSNSTYVYVTENALDPIPTWRSLQGDLPSFPVYAVEISDDDPSVVLLGTEFGVYATSDGYATSPNWVESRDGGFPSVPVFCFAQASEKPWSGSKIYAGTHGMGMFKTSSMLTSIDPEEEVSVRSEVTLYPNPANNIFSLRTNIQGPYVLNIYNFNGQLVQSQNGTSNGLVEVSSVELANGNYFVEMLGENSKAVAKVIIQH